VKTVVELCVDIRLCYGDWIKYGKGLGELFVDN